MFTEAADELVGPIALPLISMGILFAATRSWIPVIGAFIATGATYSCAVGEGGGAGMLLAPLVWNGVVLISLVIWVNGELRKLEQQTSLCPTCGYDLRGLSSNVCPECGPDPTPERGASGTDDQSSR